MGITGDMADVSDDYYLWYDLYAGMFNLPFSGNSWIFGAQAYPCTQSGNFGASWGDWRFPTGQLFNPEPQCFYDVEGLFGNLSGGVVTSNVTGTPDSIRFSMALMQACFRFSVTLACNSAQGAYFDNISFAMVDQPAAT